MSNSTSTPNKGPRSSLCVLLIVAVAAFSAWLGWVGYIESDDWFYAEAARNWAAHFPFIGSTHWGLRHMIVLPMAASFAIAGLGEGSLVLPLMIYFVFFLA